MAVATWAVDRGVPVAVSPDTVAAGPTYFRTDLPGGEPRVYADALGIHHVFVNGTQIVRNGEHTGAKPGQIVKGPGAK